MKLSLQFFAGGLTLVALCITPLAQLPATDFILTIGGGYRPESNQASLEANILFFEEVLQAQHTGTRTQDIFFGNGNDPEPDLQVLAADTPGEDSSGTQGPVDQLLEQLYGSPGGNDAVEYRKHEVPHVTGPNLPADIHASLLRMCDQMTDGDRLLVYVTAHGDEAQGRNHYNTSISCWNGQSITASEFEKWLDDVPPKVPVILVMAQCYCGGFAHTIFRNARREEGLAQRLRVGFFAQQHDLPAAGCRPDIANDAEYSSFFWGAFVERSRSGTAMPSADFNGDGHISFAEAHAHAVLTSQTIDIPLRSSEALLRAYSRIGGGYDHRRDQASNARESGENGGENDTADDATGSKPVPEGNAPGDNSSDQSVGNQNKSSLQSDPAFGADWGDDEQIAVMSGALREVIQQAAPELQRTVAGLAEQLEIDLGDDVTTVFVQFAEQRDASREVRRSRSRGRRRGGSGRRQLRAEISQRWPELTASMWRTSQLLHQADQAELLQQIAQLPNYERFTDGLQQRRETQQALEQAELREVKFQRLINTLEAIVLARNLEQFAEADVVARYRDMIALEQTGLNDLSAGR